MTQSEVDKLQNGTKLKLYGRVSFYECIADMVTDNYVRVVWVYGSCSKADIIEKHSPLWSALEVVSTVAVRKPTWHCLAPGDPVCTVQCRTCAAMEETGPE